METNPNLIGGIEETSLKQFCYETLHILCGQAPLPNTLNTIKDRSVHPSSDRVLALDYMTEVVRGMEFGVGVSVVQQKWVKETKSGLEMANLVVTLEGTENNDEVMLFGAHYDVQNSLSGCWRGSDGPGYIVTQGADDNTSGTVACLALLKKFTIQPPKQKTMVVLFDGEEPGEYNRMTEGSKKFVQEYLKQQQLKVSSCYIIDMVGAPPTCERDGLVLSVSQHVDHEDLQSKVKGVKIPYNITVAPKSSHINLLSLSDSVHFPKRNIPTVCLTNIGGNPTLPKIYHTENDDVSQIDWVFFINAIKVLFFLSENPLPTL